MGFMDTIKSLFSGNIEGKVGELMDTIIAQLKPLLASGKLGDAVKAALENYGDLGEKLKAILNKLSGATAEAKTGLVKEKTAVVSQIKAKGSTLLQSVSNEKEVPDALKELCEKAKALLAKL